MIDLKTVKEIRISEGSVTKITDSSGVVLWQKAPSASLDVDLNNQWIESTKKLDGYKVYMSNSNKGVDSGYASMKFKFKGQPNFKLWINSYAESSYDYTIAWNLDKDYPTSNPSSSTSGVKANTSNKQYNPTNITAFTEVDYANDGGEHFVVVTFRKDGSVNANDDRGYVAVKFTLLSTTWVVSSTEFIKKDGKYYEKLTEVGTYEGGLTANTGNYKEGNELPITYKQGSADDYIVNDGKMYYKNYIYVTPKDQEINTGDYIQGDYIGEATPSMKVTYTDNSEKNFYNLTSIEENTDSNKANAKSVEIYDGVTSIGNNTFNHCSSITSVTLPDTITSIGNSAFEFCSNLTSITIPSGVTSISNGVFNGCEKLTGITIPSGVTSIGDGAFSGCEKLTGITIPSGVTSIGDYAFSACKSFTSVTIPSGVTSIGSGAFQFCSNLTSITIPSGVTSIRYNAFNGCGKLTGITIPANVTYISSYAFENCSKLESVTIQNSSSKLDYEYHAFAGISSSAKLFVPSNLLSEYQADSDWASAFGGGIFEIPAMKVTYVDGTEKTFYNLTTIDKNTDSNIKNAKEVEIYDSVNSIGDNAFQSCTNLENVIFSNSLTNIGDYAFDYCPKLTNIILPNRLERLGLRAFAGCGGLTSVEIGSGLTDIGERAFYSCTGLTNITLPSNVGHVSNHAFEYCSKLASVTIEKSDYKLAYNTYNADAFNEISQTAKLYVPSNLLADYKADSKWTGAFKGGIYAIGT